MLLGALDHVDDVGLDGDVGGEAERPITELVGHGSHRVGIAVHDDDAVSSFGDEPAAQRPPDAVASTGDDRDLVSEFHSSLL